MHALPALKVVRTVVSPWVLTHSFHAFRANEPPRKKPGPDMNSMKYGLFKRDPYDGLLKSPHKWVGFHPPINPPQPGFFSLLKWIFPTTSDGSKTDVVSQQGVLMILPTQTMPWKLAYIGIVWSHEIWWFHDHGEKCWTSFQETSCFGEVSKWVSAGHLSPPRDKQHQMFVNSKNVESCAGLNLRDLGLKVKQTKNIK